MSDVPSAQVAIVDIGMGNLFSVKQACEQAGLRAVISGSPQGLLAADAVILPGVGAFSDAMSALTRLDLVSVLRDVAGSPKPLVGICLGMQLLMTESQEFGRHRGLGIIEGEVVRLSVSTVGPRAVKVPHVGWNQIYSARSASAGRSSEPGETGWDSSLLKGLADGEHMYFVHSFYARPEVPKLALSLSRYGEIDFCSSLSLGNIFACQFHPERSGQGGLQIYRNLAEVIAGSVSEEVNAREAGNKIRTT